MTGLVLNAITEALATFLIVFVIILAVNSGSDLVPIVIGGNFPAGAIAVGSVSGAELARPREVCGIARTGSRNHGGPRIDHPVGAGPSVM